MGILEKNMESAIMGHIGYITMQAQLLADS